MGPCLECPFILPVPNIFRGSAFRGPRRAVASFSRSRSSTPGRVLQTQRGQGCAGNGVQISYSFSASPDSTFRGQDVVCPGTPYASVREGDSIPAVYLSRNPAVNAIAGSRRISEPPPYPVLLFPLFALLFFAPLFWPRYSQLLRDRKLFRTGILARGRVVFVVRQQDSWFPGWPTMYPRADVHVQARLPSGEQREVKAVCANDWLTTHLPPGAEVTVVCHPRHPRAVLLENYLR
jgi:hypothetical protein